MALQVKLSRNIESGDFVLTAPNPSDGSVIILRGAITLASKFMLIGIAAFYAEVEKKSGGSCTVPVVLNLSKNDFE